MSECVHKYKTWGDGLQPWFRVCTKCGNPQMYYIVPNTGRELWDDVSVERLRLFLNNEFMMTGVKELVEHIERKKLLSELVEKGLLNQSEVEAT